MTKYLREVLEVARAFDAEATLIAKRGHARLVVHSKKFTVSGTPKNKDTALKKIKRDLKNYL